MSVLHSTRPERIRGLDTIRFLCALTVLLGHYGLPLPEALGDGATGYAKVARGILSCLFNGPAAVIVFFVISGFCIHFPQRDSLRLEYWPYVCRRVVRIGIPAFAAAGISVGLGHDLLPPYFGVFWTIICEVIYYLLYPLLLRMRRAMGWPMLIAVASALTIVLWVTHLPEIREAQHAYPAFGYLTWLNGLPCWLLGCWLAENATAARRVSAQRLWAWRSEVVVLSIALRIAKFHVPHLLASNCITLNLFAFVVCAWLGVEIAWRRVHAPNPLLEWGGQWSYSLYLTHPVAPTLAGMLFPFTASVTWAGWLGLIIACLFHYLVEAPSQKIAKHLASRVSHQEAGR